MNNDVLTECPSSPNCVSTNTTQSDKKMEAIPFTLEGPKVLKKIKTTILMEPRTKLIKETPEYLHFTFTSTIFRFVDDVEFFWI